MARNDNNIQQVLRLGFSEHDAQALRRISMTLRRWYELECGDGNGYIERDEKTGIARYFNCNSRFAHVNDPRAWRVIPDRETGAIKRMNKIMTSYPHLKTYIQTDPRGCALYILRPNDIPVGENVDSYYSRGIPVY